MISWVHIAKPIPFQKINHLEMQPGRAETKWFGVVVFLQRAEEINFPRDLVCQGLSCSLSYQSQGEPRKNTKNPFNTSSQDQILKTINIYQMETGFVSIS
jgi:hypothetical protein